MKMKDLFCTLSLFLGLLALPLPGRAQNPDSLLREAAARDQQVRVQLLEMNRRVNGGEYSAALVDSLVAAGAEMERIDRENMRLVASLLRDGLPEGLAAESMMRTTCAFTMAQGSPAYNVLPQQAWVTANMRCMPHQGTDESIEIIRAAAKKCGLDTEVLKADPACAEVNFNGDAFRLLEETSGAQVVYDPALTVDSLKRIVGRKALF